MIKIKKFSLFFIGLTLLSSCDELDRLTAKAKKIDNYEVVSLKLARQNRELKAEITALKNEIQKLRAEKNYLEINLRKYDTSTTDVSRGLASLPPVNPKRDLVKFDTYKWKPEQVLAIAKKEFSEKNFEKSAQYFMTFRTQFPKSESIDDKFLFQAGVASFESGEHPQWTLNHLETLVKAYPTSKYYRNAKLWMALTYLRLGNYDRFFNTVEEFRNKYRNTDEWKILSPHYEEIVQKFKRN